MGIKNTEFMGVKLGRIISIPALRRLLLVAGASVNLVRSISKASFAVRTSNRKSAILLSKREATRKNRNVSKVKRVSKGIFAVYLK